MPIAVVRAVSQNMVDCELSFAVRSPIDIGLAERQHASYCDWLVRQGCRLVRIDPAPDLADAVFVEDAAVVFDEVAIITRPGAVSRRPETKSVRLGLEPFRSIKEVAAPATVDGGDVLVVGKRVFVGVTARSNQAGVDSFSSFLTEFGYYVIPVPVAGCLHLKSAVSKVAVDTLLLNPEFVTADDFGGFDCIEIDPEEQDAANVLSAGGRVLIPDSHPRTAERLSSLGFEVDSINVSEIQKAEGGLTCCSLIFKE